MLSAHPKKPNTVTSTPGSHANVTKVSTEMADNATKKSTNAHWVPTNVPSKLNATTFQPVTNVFAMLGSSETDMFAQKLLMNVN